MASHESLGVPVDAFSARVEAITIAAERGCAVTYTAGNVVETVYPKPARQIVERSIQNPQLKK